MRTAVGATNLMSPVSRAFKGVAVLFAWLMFGSLFTSSNAVELWMSAPEPELRQAFHWPPNDFMKMFQSDSNWSQVSGATAAFDLTDRFVLFSSDAELKSVLDGLRARGIALSVQAEVLTFSPKCGGGIEGYSGPNAFERIGARIKSLGGSLSYIRMDEPIAFGHRYKGAVGKTACQDSVEDTAIQAAHKVAVLFQYFPNLIVGHAEPYGGGAIGKAWINEVLRWEALFEAELGKPVNFLDLDIVWNESSAAQDLAKNYSLFQSKGEKIGVIYHGLRNAETDAVWCSSILAESQLLETQLGIHPDRISIQSWMERPTRMLPETQTGTLTNAINQYMKAARSRGLEFNRRN